MNWYKGAKPQRIRGIGVASAGTRSLIHIAEGPRPQQVILLPGRSLRAPSTGSAKNFLQGLSGGSAAKALKAAGGPPIKMNVLDSVREDGAKLIEISAEDAQKLRATQPGLQIVPLRYYRPAVQFYQIENKITAARKTGTTRKIVVSVVSQKDGSPVGGANIVAFTNFAKREGTGGVTSKNGTVSLTLPSGVRQFEAVYVYPESGFWGALLKKTKLSPNLIVRLSPIALGYADGLRFFAKAGASGDGAGVKVGVVDTGIALAHPDLTVAGGECTVPGEPPSAFGPLGGDHGTHCAGIIAAHGTPPAGIRGVAPAAEIYSFRVFPKATPGGPEAGASNYSIAKAIDRAVATGCDLLNLSLGGGDPDPATEAAILDARHAGTVVIAAAGNDDRSPVSFPASYDLCVAVSALGRIGTFPAGTVEQGEVAKPFGKDKSNFIASFSNIGPELDCTGPGVGIISTVPDAAYAVMDGTSMATPAVTGIAARLLAQNAAILNANRDEARADNIVRMLLQSCRKLGFSPNLEGQGLP